VNILTYTQAKKVTFLSSRLLQIIPLFIVIPLYLIVSITNAYAAQVTLEWSPNTEADLAGYKIYYGTASGNYTESFDLKNWTATSCTITNLIEGQTYYFAATAYNISLVESLYSKEISCTINPATTSVPTTTELVAFYIIPRDIKATLIWVTEREIDNAFFNLYRSESENGEYIKINTFLIPAQGSPTQGFLYEFVDTDLQNRKTYYYKLEDVDLNRNAKIHGPVSATPRWIFGIFEEWGNRYQSLN